MNKIMKILSLLVFNISIVFADVNETDGLIISSSEIKASDVNHKIDELVKFVQKYSNEYSQFLNYYPQVNFVNKGDLISKSDIDSNIENILNSTNYIIDSELKIPLLPTISSSNINEKFDKALIGLESHFNKKLDFFTDVLKNVDENSHRQLVGIGQDGKIYVVSHNDSASISPSGSYSFEKVSEPKYIYGSSMFFVKNSNNTYSVITARFNNYNDSTITITEKNIGMLPSPPQKVIQKQYLSNMNRLYALLESGAFVHFDENTNATILTSPIYKDFHVAGDSVVLVDKITNKLSILNKSTSGQQYYFCNGVTTTIQSTGMLNIPCLENATKIVSTESGIYGKDLVAIINNGSLSLIGNRAGSDPNSQDAGANCLNASFPNYNNSTCLSANVRDVYIPDARTIVVLKEDGSVFKIGQVQRTEIPQSGSGITKMLFPKIGEGFIGFDSNGLVISTSANFNNSVNNLNNLILAGYKDIKMYSNTIFVINKKDELSVLGTSVYMLNLPTYVKKMHISSSGDIFILGFNGKLGYNIESTQNNLEFLSSLFSDSSIMIQEIYTTSDDSSRDMNPVFVTRNQEVFSNIKYGQVKTLNVELENETNLKITYNVKEIMPISGIKPYIPFNNERLPVEISINYLHKNAYIYGINLCASIQSSNQIAIITEGNPPSGELIYPMSSISEEPDFNISDYYFVLCLKSNNAQLQNGLAVKSKQNIGYVTIRDMSGRYYKFIPSNINLEQSYVYSEGNGRFGGEIRSLNYNYGWDYMTVDSCLNSGGIISYYQEDDVDNSIDYCNNNINLMSVEPLDSMSLDWFTQFN